MSLISVMFFGILPAGLLMWIGNLIRLRRIDEKAGKYWLWFLVGGLGLTIIASVIAISISDMAISFSMPILLPIVFGFTAALGLHLAQGRNIGAGKMALFFLLITLSLSWVNYAWTILWSIILVAVLTALAWLTWNQNGKQYLFLFAIEVILLGVSIRVTDINHISYVTPHWPASIASTAIYLVIPWAGIVLSALLIRRLLSSSSLNWRGVVSTLLMVAILFLMIGYQAMLTSIWDVATDGVGWIFLWLTTSSIGIGSAMLMTWSMLRKQIWFAILFALAVPFVLVKADDLPSYDENKKLGMIPSIATEQRADKIDTAIQRYYEKNNEYPVALSDLTPRYLLYIPNLLIIPKQDWCYEGSADRYRFGYVYRRFFSAPAFVRIHSSAGEPSDVNWGCQDGADKYPGPAGF